METLTVGLCLSTGTCKPEDVRGGEQFSLSPLKTVLQEAREAVTPGFIEEAVEFWQGTGVAVGALGGWLVLMFITVQMARWVSTATKVRITGWWRRCWEPVQAAQEPEHRPHDPEAGAPRRYPIPQFQVEGIRDKDMKCDNGRETRQPLPRGSGQNLIWNYDSGREIHQPLPPEGVDKYIRLIYQSNGKNPILSLE